MMKVTVNAIVDVDAVDLAEHFVASECNDQATFMNFSGFHFSKLPPPDRDRQYCWIAKKLDSDGMAMIKELAAWIEHLESKK